PGQRRHPFVKREQLIVVWRREHIEVLDSDWLRRPASFLRTAGTRVLDEDSPHGGGGNREELLAAVEIRIGEILAEPQPCLMCERRCTQRVIAAFPAHVRRGELAELSVDQLEESRLRAGLLPLHLQEQLRHLSRGRCHRRSRSSSTRRRL